jgi:hypothetical protein
MLHNLLTAFSHVASEKVRGNRNTAIKIGQPHLHVLTTDRGNVNTAVFQIEHSHRDGNKTVLELSGAMRGGGISISLQKSGEPAQDLTLGLPRASIFGMNSMVARFCEYQGYQSPDIEELRRELAKEMPIERSEPRI